jgi:transposase
VLAPRQEYSREPKLAAMREIDSGKGMAEVARMYPLSPKRLETGGSEWRAKGDLAFPGKGAQPQSKLNADRISELERKIGQQTMEIDFFKKALRRFREHPLLVRRRRPPIQFLSIDPYLCSTLPSDPTSR